MAYRTATFETNSHARSNGGGSGLKVNGYHHPFPPPTPQHTYSRKNSLANQGKLNGSLKEEEDRDEQVINISRNGAATCQQDLEEDSTPLIRLGPSENNTCSGTESEKYYSGDSEPEGEDPGFDEESRYSVKKTSGVQTLRSMVMHNLPVSKSTSMSPSPCSICAFQENPSSHRGILPSNPSSSTSVVPRNRKTSPKQCHNVGINGFAPVQAIPSAGELVLNSSVERLNRDVDHIVARLRILETAYASSMDEGGRVRRRRFGGLSPAAIAFLVVWPFAVTFLLKVVGWRWRRRRRGIMSLAARSLR